MFVSHWGGQYFPDAKTETRGSRVTCPASPTQLACGRVRTCAPAVCQRSLDLSCLHNSASFNCLAVHSLWGQGGQRSVSGRSRTAEVSMQWTGRAGPMASGVSGPMGGVPLCGGRSLECVSLSTGSLGWCFTPQRTVGFELGFPCSLALGREWACLVSCAFLTTYW